MSEPDATISPFTRATIAVDRPVGAVLPVWQRLLGRHRVRVVAAHPEEVGVSQRDHRAEVGAVGIARV